MKLQRNWKQWAKAAGIRAAKTMVQTLVAMIGVDVAISDVNWLSVCSATVLAGVLSVLTSVAGLPEIDPGESEAEAGPDTDTDTDDEIEG
jgi:Putative lactococcus lactis phage r1t holin